MTAKHKHIQLLLQLLSRHQTKTGPKTSRKLNFPAVGGARCAQSSIIGGAMSKKVQIQNFIVNILTYVALNREVNTCGAFSKPCSQNWSKEATHVVFGGIPSLLHIHDIHVKDRPELHLHKADRSAPTLGTLQKELLIHTNNRQDSRRSPRGTCAERKFRKEPSSSQQKLHRRRDAGASAE